MARDYAELFGALSEGIAALTSSDRWTQYLNVQSRFPRYSPNNVMLILTQKPDATRVAGYRAWQAMGHQVLAKESALRVFAPMKYRDADAVEGAAEIRGFKLVPVFDISQTSGPDLPDIVSKLHGRAPEGVFASLSEFAEGIGFTVERPASLASGANGDTVHATGLIRVAASNEEAQQVKTLAHEIGHALLHDPGVAANRELSRELKELEAESVAYIICRGIGMETGEYSFGYVAGWAGGGEEALRGIKASTSRIQRAAAAVLGAFEEREPAAEAVNVVSAGVSRDHWRDVEVALDAGVRWHEYRGEFARIHDLAKASEGRIHFIAVDAPTSNAPLNTSSPLGVPGLSEPDVTVDAYHEVEM